MAALRDRLEKKIISVYQQIRTKPTPTVTYPYKISPTLVHRSSPYSWLKEVEDFQRLAPITSIWFEIVENCQPTSPPTKDFALRKKYVFTLD